MQTRLCYLFTLGAALITIMSSDITLLGVSKDMLVGCKGEVPGLPHFQPISKGAVQ